jgi:hypothetical protein
MMRIGRRRPGLPTEAAAALGIADASRVLAWSELEGGGAAAATVEDLRILTPRGALIARPWVEVDHAVWDQDSRTLAVFWIGTRQTTPLEVVGEGGRLPEVIRERVQASVVLTASVPLPGGRIGRVALRKATDGALTTQQLLPPGVKPDAPGVAAAMAAAAATLQSEAGLRTEAPPSIF